MYCLSMLSWLKLTNAHTVRGRPTLENDTARFGMGWSVNAKKNKQNCRDIQ